jgi:hypothetical protein
MSFPRLLAAACVLACAWPAAVMAADRALLVAVGSNPGFSALAGPPNDARDMRDFAINVLGYQSQNVRVLVDEEATIEAVDAAMRKLARDTSPGDRVLLYFSGHGLQLPDRNGDEKTDALDEALVLWDTACVARKPDGSCLHEDVRQAWLDDDIDAALSQLEGRKITVVIDSCHSGTASRSAEVDANSRARTPQSVRAGSSSRGSIIVARPEIGPESLVDGPSRRVVWSAVADNQEALDSIETKPVKGLFTELLIRGVGQRVADTNRDGALTHAELLDWLRAESDAYCSRNPPECKGQRLTPMLEAPPGVLLAPVEASLLYASPGAGSPGQMIQTAFDPATGSAAMRLRLRVLDSAGRPVQGPFRKGQRVEFELTSSAPGALVVIGLDARDRLYQLYPNPASARVNALRGLPAASLQRIEANVPFRIPDPTWGFSIVAAEPFGASKLVALVTQDPVDLSDILQEGTRGLAIVPIGTPGTLLERIARRLRLPWPDDDNSVRPIRWAAALYDYETAP